MNLALLKKRKLIDAAGDKDDKKRIKQHRAKKKQETNRQTQKRTKGGVEEMLRLFFRRCVALYSLNMRGNKTDLETPSFFVFWAFFLSPDHAGEWKE